MSIGPPVSASKPGTEKRYTQVIDYTSTSCVYRILRQTVQLEACSRFPDVRRTVVTNLSENSGSPKPHVTEAIANYISGAAKAGVVGNYNKAAYYAERQRALEAMGRPFDGSAIGLKADS